MSKQKKIDKAPREGTGRSAAPALIERIDAGDNRGARAMAVAMLADSTTPEPDRAAARDALARTGVDQGALSAGLIGLAIIAVLASLLLLH